jgi:hypothetical protein
MFIYGYAQSVNTPAPEIEATVVCLDVGGRQEKVVCVVDTAASKTCIPRALIERLAPKTYTSGFVVWGSGQRSRHDMFRVGIEVGPKNFILWVVATEKSYGLLGRDVLNDHTLTCDGPNLRWGVQPPWI